MAVIWALEAGIMAVVLGADGLAKMLVAPLQPTKVLPMKLVAVTGTTWPTA